MSIQDDERLPGAMQENVLTLLCFDSERGKLVRHAIQPNIFDSAVYKDIATQAVNFFDQYGSAIGEHLPDTLDHILNGQDRRKASSYKRTLEGLFHLKDQMHGDYVLQQLNKFVRRQHMKSAIVKAVELIESDKVDDAEVILQEGLTSQIVSFDGGTRLSDVKKSLKFLDNQDHDGFFLGIDELDKANCLMRRKELMLFMAPRGRGKSWFMTHVAKMGVVQRACVVIFTLEMSEESYSERLVQAMFSVSKRDNSVNIPVLEKDSDGMLTHVDHEELQRHALTDPDIKPYLANRIRREFKRKPPLIVKEFPTGSMTISMMKAYLDGLERFHKITPDIIVVDYPDLMDIDSKNLRVETGKIYASLRGIAVERKCALVAASQGNRESETARTVTGSMAAEDISKLAIADTVLTYSQTPGEKKMGLARLLVDKNRKDMDKFQVLISQSYQMGQFHLDSVRMGGDYWDIVEPRSHNSEED